MTRKCLFETLSSDELGVVIRKLSAQPRSQYWRQHLGTDVLMLIFVEHSPFSCALSKVISRVDINGIAAPGRLRVSGDDALNLRILERTRGSLGEVLLLDRPVVQRYVDDDVYRDFMLYCGGLKKLRLELDEDSFRAPLLDTILATHASSIEHLSLVLMAYSATNYRLPLDIMPKLKSLHIVDCQPEKYIPVFNTYSSTTLEELDISGRFVNWRPLMNAIRTKLRSLHTVVLHSCGTHIPQAEHVALLISYGAQLRYARLLELSSASCTQVLAQCPNVLCDAHFSASEASWFLVAAPHVAQLTVPDVGFDRVSLQSFQASAERCLKIQSVRCTILSKLPDTLQALFCIPKPTLKELIIVARNLTLTQQLAQGLTLVTGNLHKLNLTVHKLGPDSLVCGIVEEAKELRETRITQTWRADQKRALSIALSLLQVAVTLPHLHDIAVHSEVQMVNATEFKQRVRDAAERYRMRQTRVEVCGTIYCK